MALDHDRSAGVRHRHEDAADRHTVLRLGPGHPGGGHPPVRLEDPLSPHGHLAGDARVNRPATAKEEALEFRGEFLHAFRNVEVVRSIPELDQAAIDAIKQWEYVPLLVDGVPTPTTFEVTVQFSL